MAQRTITISESAAKALDDLKVEGESISDVCDTLETDFLIALIRKDKGALKN